MSDVGVVPAVELRHVARIFEGDVHALDGVDLVVDAGEFVAITGPSGCGKSTLLSLVAALDFPTSGSVVVDGRDLRTVRDLARYRREEVGLVFQLHNLLTHQSVLGNVEVAMFGTGRHRLVRRARAHELLAAVDLAGLEHRRPAQLAGGERQRVAVARALANNPRLLLADEPTGSLDSASARRVLALFKRFHSEGMAVILATHDDSVAAVADRVVIMRDGQVTDAGARRPSSPTRPSIRPCAGG